MKYYSYWFNYLTSASLTIYTMPEMAGIFQSRPILYIGFWVVPKKKAFWTSLILFLVINDRRLGSVLWDMPPSYDRKLQPWNINMSA